MNDQHGKNHHENQDSPQADPAFMGEPDDSPGTTKPAGVSRDQFEDAVERKAQDDAGDAGPAPEESTPAALDEDEESIVNPKNS